MDSSNLHFICISGFGVSTPSKCAKWTTSQCFSWSSHCCGLTSHSAIFKHTVTMQLSIFEIKTYCQVPAPWAARVLRVMTTITRTPGRPKTSLTSLPLEGTLDFGVRPGSNVDLPIHCPAHYLYATGTGHGDMKIIIRC